MGAFRRVAGSPGALRPRRSGFDDVIPDAVKSVPFDVHLGEGPPSTPRARVHTSGHRELR